MVIPERTDSWADACSEESSPSAEDKALDGARNCKDADDDERSTDADLVMAPLNPEADEFYPMGSEVSETQVMWPAHSEVLQNTQCLIEAHNSAIAVLCSRLDFLCNYSWNLLAAELAAFDQKIDSFLTSPVPGSWLNHKGDEENTMSGLK
eukprot:11256802-Karenia_brevis.AAC.1